MTKPPRQRPANTTRKAATYNRLDPERYAQLDPIEQRRHDAHLDIDAIHDAHQYAQLDQRAHGWPHNLRPRDGSRSTDEGALNAVESWSQKDDPASDWLAEYEEVRAAIIRLANDARYHFGFDPERGRPEPGRPQRRNTVENCVWCHQPAPEGRDPNGRPLIHRVDQKPLHANTCYYQADRQARAEGVTLATLVARKIAS